MRKLIVFFTLSLLTFKFASTQEIEIELECPTCFSEELPGFGGNRRGDEFCSYFENAEEVPNQPCTNASDAINADELEKLSESEAKITLGCLEINIEKIEFSGSMTLKGCYGKPKLPEYPGGKVYYGNQGESEDNGGEETPQLNLQCQLPSSTFWKEFREGRLSLNHTLIDTTNTAIRACFCEGGSGCRGLAFRNRPSLTEGSLYFIYLLISCRYMHLCCG